MNASPMNPITEDDIANFLVNTPDFFTRHAELLSAVRLTSPHSQRAVSLQERQAEMLREKIRALELRMMDMIRNGNDNAILADRLHRWAQRLLLTRASRDLPDTVVDQIQSQFMVPQVALRVWDVADEFTIEPFAQGGSEEVRAFASSLTQPYCGVNTGFEAAKWLQDPAAAQSLAMVALRPTTEPPTAALADAPERATVPPAIGLLVLASPDAQRYHAGMGTEFLERMGEMASAALSRLR
jgi:uncharacterized protein YigA (DUF484 family)